MSTGTQGAPPVLLVGEALVDIIVPPDGREPRRMPGGSVANVAVTLARLGRRARLLTATGPDDDGRAVRDWLADSGVEVAEGSDAAVRTSVARATLGSDGQARYDFDIVWSLPPGDVVDRAAGDAVHVHVGSIGAVVAPGATQVLAVVGAASDAGTTVSYDPNVRPAIMGDPASTLVQVEQIVAQSDVVKVSDEDLAWLVPGERAVTVAHRWADLGPSLVVVTTGADGCVAVHGGATLVVPGVRTSVVDTVGAGDTFMGALIDGLSARGLLGRGHRDALANVDHGSLREVLERCARAAAVTVSREGANPPTAQELDAL